MMKNLNKKIISIILIVILLGAFLVNVTIYRFIPVGPKPFATTIDAGCGPDMCISKNLERINVYMGIRNEAQCQEVGGYAVSYYGVGGNKIFYACSLEDISE